METLRVSTVIFCDYGRWRCSASPLRSFRKEPKLVLGLDRAVGLVGLVPCPGISKIRLVGHLAASKAVREREISSTS